MIIFLFVLLDIALMFAVVVSRLLIIKYCSWEEFTVGNLIAMIALGLFPIVNVSILLAQIIIVYEETCPKGVLNPIFGHITAPINKSVNEFLKGKKS